MPEEISIEERIETRLSKLFSFSLFYRYDAHSRGGDRNEHPSSIVEREESEVDSASSCSPKHIHRPRCERNFTGYIDKRAGSQVGQPGGGAGGGREGGREEKGDAKKTSGGRAQLFRIQFLYFVLLETYETKRISKRILTLLPGWCTSGLASFFARVQIFPRLFCPSSHSSPFPSWPREPTNAGFITVSRWKPCRGFRIRRYRTNRLADDEMKFHYA